MCRRSDWICRLRKLDVGMHSIWTGKQLRLSSLQAYAYCVCYYEDPEAISECASIQLRSLVPDPTVTREAASSRINTKDSDLVL